MANQHNNIEETKDRIRISGDGFYSAPIQNYPTKNQIYFRSSFSRLLLIHYLSCIVCLFL